MPEDQTHAGIISQSGFFNAWMLEGLNRKSLKQKDRDEMTRTLIRNPTTATFETTMTSISRITMSVASERTPQLIIQHMEHDMEILYLST